MTSSNGNIFRVTVPFVRASMFYFIYAWTNGWVNNRDTGDFRRHRVYYYVTVRLCDYSRWFVYLSHGKPMNKFLWNFWDRSDIIQETIASILGIFRITIWIQGLFSIFIFSLFISHLFILELGWGWGGVRVCEHHYGIPYGQIFFFLIFRKCRTWYKGWLVSFCECFVALPGYWNWLFDFCGGVQDAAYLLPIMKNVKTNFYGIFRMGRVWLKKPSILGMFRVNNWIQGFFLSWVEFARMFHAPQAKRGGRVRSRSASCEP